MSNIDELESYLDENGFVAKEDDFRIRKLAIETVQSLLNSWVEEFFKEKDLNFDSKSSVCYAKLFTSGSYAMGCFSKNSDVDLVCLLSKHFTRDSFFKDFKIYLQREPAVKCVHAVEQSICPLIKMNVNDVDVDISLAIVNREILPEDYLDAKLMNSMDEISIKSYIGLKSVGTFLKLIPNKEKFVTFLNCIKLWTKRKGLYSNTLGYLSGTSCSILCAYICTNFENLDVFQSIKMFYKVFSEWPWPEPVTLTYVQEGSSNHQSWNRHIGGGQVMPVITPDFPHKNCTYNVTLATKKVIVKHFKDALEVIERIERRDSNWDTFFKMSTFSEDFKFFLAIIVTSDCQKDQTFWQGLIESKIRYFVIDLSKNSMIKELQVHPTSFTYRNKFGECLTKWLIGLQIDTSTKSVLDIQAVIKYFRYFVMNKAKQNEWFKESMMIFVDSLNGKEINPVDYIPNKLKDFEPTGK